MMGIELKKRKVVEWSLAFVLFRRYIIVDISTALLSASSLVVEIF